MGTLVDAAVRALAAKLTGRLDGVAKFVIAGEGSVIIDADGVRAADDPADVTLTADADTFRAILEGDLSPTSAFMKGRLGVEGDMGLAMKLGSVLG